MGKCGLFVGLVTLDLIYLVEALPGKNQKIAASDYTVSAGGPATNAAVTFSYLGNQVSLFSILGRHPMTHLIRAELASHRVGIADLAPNHVEPPPVSSILVTQSTGERAVVSLNAAKIQAKKSPMLPNDLHGIDVVLIDAHQIEVGAAIAQTANNSQVPVVLDGGSWKPGLEEILPWVDYAICSANFYPPGCSHSHEVFTYLSDIGISNVAITHGEQPIEYWKAGDHGCLDVPQISAVDTLGAGDIFHGAFCHYILETEFVAALEKAAQVAAHSCRFFGTRRWMQENNDR